MGRRFGPREVVRRLDLSLEPGQRLGLHGPNGSGKTTVLRCIAGTLALSAGRISIGGYPAGTVEARQLIGASLSQDRSFYLRLSGRANLLFFARIRYDRDKASRRVDAVVEELEVHEFVAQRVDKCSSGMIQQLALARALLGEPSLLLLDEPTRSLDTAAVARLWSALDRRPQTGVLFASHLEDDLARCDGRIDFPS